MAPIGFFVSTSLPNSTSREQRGILRADGIRDRPSLDHKPKSEREIREVAL